MRLQLAAATVTRAGTHPQRPDVRTRRARIGSSLYVYLFHKFCITSSHSARREAHSDRKHCPAKSASHII